MATPTQSYIYFNSNINVDMVKVGTSINQNFQEVKSQKEAMFSTDILFHSFVKQNSNDSGIEAKYFSPENTENGSIINIYRKTPHQNYYNYICTLANGEYEFMDYNISNKEFYHYLAAIEIPAGDKPKHVIYENWDENGNLLYRKANWNRWSICDIEETTEGNIYQQTGDVWILGYNLEGEDLVSNTSVTTWDTLSKYPKISIGQKNYESSSFTCLLGEMTQYKKYSDINNYKETYEYTEKMNLDNYYAREVEKMQAWREFCNNGRLKLLKDIKGNAWIIQILANPSRKVDIQAGIMPTAISFEWQEVEDINSVSIIGFKES